MSDGNSETIFTEKKEDERQRGARGEVGTATASQTIKQRYHQACFKQVDAEDKHNPGKKLWVKLEGAPSLKQYARKLLASGDPTVKDWFGNKRGAKNAQRSEKNIAEAHAAAAATKVERRKRSAGNTKK
jgi:hypothetical protein